jgi:DNA-binding NtrC family response regulator
MPTVLIIEDEVHLAGNIAEYMRRRGWDAEIALTAEEGLSRVSSIAPDVILLDFNLPRMDGLATIDILRERDPQARVVMMTGRSSVQLAVDAMKAGAVDFLVKPLSLQAVNELLQRVVRDVRLQRRVDYHHAREHSTTDRLIGDSKAMLALKAHIRQVASAEPVDGGAGPSILIFGETGCGKELVARACHYESRRRNAPFIEVNCAAIPANLLESELFGYERGAFTDARERKIGLIEAAEHGTLFLDEISEMDSAVQAKLLKFLDDHRMRRLGGLHDRHVNVRVIAATNRPIERLERQGSFRADLLHRLSVIRLLLPPLRQRGSDIAQLARHFVAEIGARYSKSQMGISSEAIQMLEAYDWPGNVREMRNVLEHAVVTTDGAMIEAANISLPTLLSGWSTPEPSATAESGGNALSNAEREVILQALESCEWNVVKTARLLGVTRDTLRYRLRRHGLQRPDTKSE